MTSYLNIENAMVIEMQVAHNTLEITNLVKCGSGVCSSIPKVDWSTFEPKKPVETLNLA